MFTIPFKINPYEEALINTVSFLSTTYPSSPRFRTYITEKHGEMAHTIIGYCALEAYNEKNDTWVETVKSPTFTVKADHIPKLDNAGAAKCMIKFLYFCTKSMGIEMPATFEKESLSEVIDKFQPKKSWEQEMKDRNIDIIEFSGFTTIKDLRRFFASKGYADLFSALEITVRTKHKTTKPSPKMFRDFVWGKEKAKSANKLAKPRPAKRKPEHSGNGFVPTAAPTKKAEQADVQVVVKRTTDEVNEIVNKMKRLGIVRSTFAEKFPSLSAKYGGSPLMFAQNCTDSELIDVYAAK
jgi:hypothetical protein